MHNLLATNTNSFIDILLLDLPGATGDGVRAVLLLLAIAVPLVCGLVLMLTGRVSDRFSRVVSVFGFFVPFVVALWMWMGFGHYVEDGYFIGLDLPTGVPGVALKLGLNGISLPLFMLAAIVGFAAGVYALRSKAPRLRQYLTLLLIMHGGIMGVFASVDVFFFYFFHEIALIPSFLGILLYGTRIRRVAAMQMAVYLTVGAMLSLIGLLAIYVKSGADSFDMITLREVIAQQGFAEFDQQVIFGLLLFGFGILVSLFPLHSWAPDTYYAAPSSVAMMHAGVLKKFGLYGLIQIAYPLLPQGGAHWNELLIWLALGNIIIIGFVTIAQRDLRYMVSYSSVMHMGYAFLGIACMSALGIGGAVLMMFAHGLSVSLLLLLTTCIHHRTKEWEMADLGGLGKRTPVLAGFFVAATMASIGLPGFANFWGELAIFVALWEFKPWVAVVAVFGIVISAVYGLRAARKVFFGREHEAMQSLRAEGVRMSDMTPQERFPALVLLLAMLIVGLWPRSVSDTIHASAVMLEETTPKATAGVEIVEE